MTEQIPRGGEVVLAVGNDPYDSALAYAAAEATRAGCGLHLVYAVHLVPTGPDSMLVEMTQLTQIGREVLAEAAERAADLMGPDATITTQLMQGSVVSSLVSASAGARLVVLQRRALGGVWNVVTRRVSSGVAAHARVPVASVPTGWEVGAEPSVVTVGVDEPERSRAVLGAALAEARARGADLRVLHTWWFPNAYDEVLLKRVEDDTWARRARDEITAVLHDLGPTVAGAEEVKVRVDVLNGHAGDALVEASQDSALLLVGRHDPLMPFGSHLGPIARAVLREAACPVLLVDAQVSP